MCGKKIFHGLAQPTVNKTRKKTSALGAGFPLAVTRHCSGSVIAATKVAPAIGELIPLSLDLDRLDENDVTAAAV